MNDARPNGALVAVERGSTSRDDFGSTEIDRSAETAVAAVTAREEALIKAQYVMAERHPRNWMNVRAGMLDHCVRPRFADVSRYSKPVGKKYINGEWVEQYARGFTIRFAETLAQEMGNVKPESAITYENDLLRVVRIAVTDLQRNVPWSREVSFAKAVERRGRQNKKSGEWEAPEGRDVISQRINSKGEVTYLVKATEDEMRAKVNSEIAKTQRDFLIKLCPRDLLEDWEDAVYSTLEKEDKTDPAAALKRWLDAMHKIGVEPTDLEVYFGKPVKGFGQAEVNAIRELGQAIKEGSTTFQDALRMKFDTSGSERTAEEIQADRDKVMRDRGMTEGQVANAHIPNVSKLPDPTPLVPGEKARVKGKVCEVIRDEDGSQRWAERPDIQ